MFKPLRFNPLLKAIPGLAHLSLTPKAHHVQSHSHVEAERIEAVPHGIKETHVRENVHKDVKVSTKKGYTTTEIHEHISEDIRVKKVQSNNVVNSDTLARVHATICDIASVELTPPHGPREDTPIYQKTHRHLVYTLDTPCAICGVRNSTLHDPKENTFGAQAIETHHYPIERSLMNACDPKKIHIMFPQVKDYESLEAFIDSEENIMVLCDIHHRHPYYGIHHILAQDFFIQPYLYGGYQVVSDAENANKVMAANEKVMKRHTPKAESPRGTH